MDGQNQAGNRCGISYWNWTRVWRGGRCERGWWMSKLVVVRKKKADEEGKKGPGSRVALGGSPQQKELRGTSGLTGWMGG